VSNFFKFPENQLLLQSSGGETPLVHAIRTGNKDVAIVLLGAFSRWINYLEDADIRKAQTQSYLKTLREYHREGFFLNSTLVQALGSNLLSMRVWQNLRTTLSPRSCKLLS